MKIRLKTGKRVHFVDEYGPEQHITAAELSGVPAQMSQADLQLLGIATIMVAVVGVDEEVKPEVVDPQTKKVTEPAQYSKMKTVEALCGDAVATKDVLLNFRKSFTNTEWQQTEHAFNKVFDDVKKDEVEDYKIEH